MKDFSQHITFKVVINKAYNQQEAEQVFYKINAVAENFLGVKLQYVGFVPYDEKVFHAVKKQIPIVAYDQRAKASIAYETIAKEMGDITVLDDNNYQWIHRFKKIFQQKR